MALEDALLRPWALTNLDTAREYMKLNDAADDTKLILAVNKASGSINRRTRRMLKSMPYTSPVTVNNINGNDASTTISTTDNFDSVRDRMMVTGTGVRPGTFVLQVVDSTTIELNVAPETTPSLATFVFSGLGPSVMDGRGTDTVRLPEYPTTEVLSVSSRASDGSFSAMSTTGYLVGASGILTLPGDVLSQGSENVYVEHVSGLLPGRHDSQLDALEGACLRLVQVMMMDEETPVGRGTGVNVQGFGFSLIDSAMPRDIAAIVDTFKRWV